MTEDLSCRVVVRNATMDHLDSAEQWCAQQWPWCKGEQWDTGATTMTFVFNGAGSGFRGYNRPFRFLTEDQAVQFSLVWG